MNDGLDRAVRAYRLLFVAFIVFVSVRTALQVHSGSGVSGHPSAFLLLLAGIEIVSAVGFLFRWTRLIAGIGLLLVFATGTTVGLLNGELPFNLVFYAGTVGLLLVYGRQGTVRP